VKRLRRLWFLYFPWLLRLRVFALAQVFRHNYIHGGEPGRQSRNQARSISRKGARAAKSEKRTKIISHNFYLCPSNLATLRLRVFSPSNSFAQSSQILSYSNTEYAEENFFRKKLGTLTQILFGEFHFCFSCDGAAHFLFTLLFEQRIGFNRRLKRRQARRRCGIFNGYGKADADEESLIRGI
jgi:hypothetical protein